MHELCVTTRAACAPVLRVFSFVGEVDVPVDLEFEVCQVSQRLQIQKGPTLPRGNPIAADVDGAPCGSELVELLKFPTE
ncbi:hypothetical protein ASC87_14275 [Rhizobacter sp. Root1221]|nr:hypothetical protein ASC87_14275 [Rhizobacter sp. Root1221]